MPAKARECFKALDEAGLKAPIPLSYGQIGDDERCSALSLDIGHAPPDFSSPILWPELAEVTPGSNSQTW